MEEILSDLKSGRWWFSTVAVAIAVSIISNIIWELIIKKHLIDKNKGYEYCYSNNRYIYYIDRYYKFSSGCAGALIGSIVVFIITTIGLECLLEKEYIISNFQVFPGENIYGEKFYKFINLSFILIYITFVHIILTLLFFDIPDSSVAKIKKIIKVNIFISIFGLLFLFLNKTLLISHPVLMLTTGCFSGILFFSREKYFDVSLMLYPIIAFCALVFSHALSSCASLIIMLIDTLFINRRNLNIDLVYIAGSIAYGAVLGFIGAIIPAIFSEKIREK